MNIRGSHGSGNSSKYLLPLSDYFDFFRIFKHFPYVRKIIELYYYQTSYKLPRLMAR